MIVWSSITITSPPILRNISTALFRSIVRDKKNPEWDFVLFPYDTQAVERCAKSNAIGPEYEYDPIVQPSSFRMRCLSGNSLVGGNIRRSNIEETVTESRKVFIAKEESALEKTSRRRALKKTVVWKTFKSIVFLICLIFLIIQSVKFFNIYYKYPTTIVTHITVAKEFKLPAITFCFRNT
ncbi:hypothetical protein AVEN_271265-1 [Araneus ventricosus]|uniref:Uncharacterized protein n=1 Tax=Araneus ventricosus TaxID=182803 RepID=A0A4Y2G5M2_ARAVE|nr:hypothetical protein AVEN_271265-1 [Araneus ventricosus]